MDFDEFIDMNRSAKAEDEDYLEMANEILAAAGDDPNFDDEFLLVVKDYVRKGLILSGPMRDAVKNIHTAWVTRYKNR